MDTSTHNINGLFEQLGLESDEANIDQFIEKYGPLKQGVELADAPFWSRAQSAFLKEGWTADSDWAEAIDELNVRLRS